MGPMMKELNLQLFGIAHAANIACGLCTCSGRNYLSVLELAQIGRRCVHPRASSLTGSGFGDHQWRGPETFQTPVHGAGQVRLIVVMLCDCADVISLPYSFGGNVYLPCSASGFTLSFHVGQHRYYIKHSSLPCSDLMSAVSAAAST